MQKVAGALFFLAGITITMGIINAEIFYSGYSISLNMISTLGASPPPDSIIKQPSATIFDYAIALSGIMILIGTCDLYIKARKKLLLLPFMLLGVGALGVGIFPAFHPLAHPISALLAFLSGGIAAITSSRYTTAPFSYIAFFLGIITLVFLFIGMVAPQLVVPIFGRGGTERWVAYPVILWLTAYGGYLMGSAKSK